MSTKLRFCAHTYTTNRFIIIEPSCMLSAAEMEEKHMARRIYEIQLKNRFIPGLSQTDAAELWNEGEEEGKKLNEDEVEVNIVCSEEDTMKLFILAKIMYDTDKFNATEIERAVSTLATTLGYKTSLEIAECVVRWVERMTDDMTLAEIEEWIIG